MTAEVTAEKKTRHEWAVRQIDAGMGQRINCLYRNMGVLPEQARDVVAAAHKDWLDMNSGRSISGICFSSRLDG